MENPDVLILVGNHPNNEKLSRIWKGLTDNGIRYRELNITKLYFDNSITAKAVIAMCNNNEAAIGYLASRFGDALIVVGDSYADSTIYLVNAHGGVHYADIDQQCNLLLGRVRYILFTQAGYKPNL